MAITSYILAIIPIAIHIGYYIEIIRTKKIHFLIALPLVLFSMASFMLIYFLLENLSAKKKRICEKCGNTANEAEYCGLCGRNVSGEYHPGWIKMGKKQ